MVISRVIAALLVFASLASAVGCAWEPTRTEYSRAASPTGIAMPAGQVYLSVADSALEMVGAPYKWGGESPEGFDCSGLVYYAYGRHGISVPRTAAAQLAAASPVELDDARAGDLLFFRTGARGRHVGILLEDGRFVHAPSRGKRVTLGGLRSGWYRDRLIGVGRIGIGQ